jgi:hypothetical protein
LTGQHGAGKQKNRNEPQRSHETSSENRIQRDAVVSDQRTSVFVLVLPLYMRSIQLTEKDNSPTTLLSSLLIKQRLWHGNTVVSRSIK